DIHEPPDARLAPLAQRLTMIEQLTEDVAQLKTRREACRDTRIRAFWKQEIDRLKRLLQGELKQLVAAIREHRDLADRLDLIASVDGVGPRTAVAILVRMPEIGRVSREQAAACARKLLNLRQYGRCPRDPLEVRASNHLMVAQDEGGAHFSAAPHFSSIARVSASESAEAGGNCSSHANGRHASMISFECEVMLRARSAGEMRGSSAELQALRMMSICSEGSQRVAT